MSGQALITRARQGKGASWTGRWAHRGFSLVELMVGMVIGFITLAVIVQSLSVFEVHKTTTTAAADAQENGLLALSAIERDTRRAAAGYPAQWLKAGRKSTRLNSSHLKLSRMPSSA